MSESDNIYDNTVPRAFMESLGFELPDEAFSFQIDGSDIVFTLQIVEEVGCDFRIFEQQERFPLTDEQVAKLRECRLLPSRRVHDPVIAATKGLRRRSCKGLAFRLTSTTCFHS